MAATGLAAVFLFLYAALVIGRPDGGLEVGLDAAMLITWGAFAIDYLARLLLAPDRGRWFLRHLHLLAIVALPFFRPLYLLRLVALLGVLQRATGTALRGRVTLYVVISAALLIVIAGFALLGSVTAALASWFVERIHTEHSPETSEQNGRTASASPPVGGDAL